MWLPLLTLALVCLGATGPSYATQEPPRARAVRVDEGPVIDGRLDDPVWRQAFAIE